MAGAVVSGYTPQRTLTGAEQQQQEQMEQQRLQDQQLLNGGGFGATSPVGISPVGYGGSSSFTPSAPTSGYQSGGALGTAAAQSGGQMPGGGISQNAYEDQQRMQLEARLGQEAFAQRLAALSRSGGGSVDRVQHDAGGNEDAVRANAFARAKDSAGLNAQAALKSLHAVMSATGRTGSSQEADRAYNILGEGRSDVNTFIDKQLESDLSRGADVADMTYQGNITQRAQDIAARQALQGLMMTSGRLY